MLNPFNLMRLIINIIANIDDIESNICEMDRLKISLSNKRL